MDGVGRARKIDVYATALILCFARADLPTVPTVIIEKWLDEDYMCTVSYLSSLFS